MSGILENLRREEGFRARPYLCPRGVATIGYGTSLEAHPEYLPDGGLRSRVKAGQLKGAALVQACGDMTWTEAQATDALKAHVAEISRALGNRIPGWFGLDLDRRAVLVEMAYQLGVGGVLKFKRMLQALSLSEYEAAACHMLDSSWAEQTPARAKRLAERMAGHG